MLNIALEMPALTGETVTQAHADYCAHRGHATHTVGDDVSPWCPRCGASVEVPRVIQCHRDCYGATTEAPRRALPYGSTDRLVHAAIKQGFADWNEGRVIHVTGCTEH